MQDDWMKNSKGRERKRSWPDLRYYARISLQELQGESGARTRFEAGTYRRWNSSIATFDRCNTANGQAFRKIRVCILKLNSSRVKMLPGCTKPKQPHTSVINCHTINCWRCPPHLCQLHDFLKQSAHTTQSSEYFGVMWRELHNAVTPNKLWADYLGCALSGGFV
jgi:hypothetical protein